MDAITGLAKKAQAEFVKSDDFTGALQEAITSATSETVNKAITSKLKSFENRFDSKIAEAVKEAVPPKDDDDEPTGDDAGAKDLTDEAILKSKPYRALEKSHTKLQAELEKDRSERQNVEATAFRKERDAEVQTVATALRVIDPGVVVAAVRDRIVRDDSGDLVVETKDKEGNVEKVQTTEEFVAEYVKARPFLVKASDGGGAGSGSGTGGGAGGGGEGEEIKPEDLKDPVKYRELRAKGRIHGVPAPEKTS